MINSVNDEKIVLEIRNLVQGIESTKDEINIYCDLMKQLFLKTSEMN